MKEDLKCMFGMHRFCIFKEEQYLDVRGNVIGTIIVSRCEHCGKIKINKIILVNQGL